jgi:uncharacterized membrane protein/mono/diheme cytochrome c family protein
MAHRPDHRRAPPRRLHRDSNVRPVVAGALALGLVSCVVSAVSADDQLPSLATQVHAIFQAKCVECHAADLAHPKGKFGYVLDLPRVTANPKMIVPGNPAKSELFQMVWHNEMPDPKGDSPPLTPEEKAIVKAWIETGASTTPGTGTLDAAIASTNTASSSTLRWRITRDAGQFHPPSTHFPIALLIVALPAEFMWMLTRKESWRNTVRFCVVLGAASAVLTATLGWCDAAVSQYSGAALEILTWHRWVGTATAVWAVVVAAVSEFANRRGNPDRWCLVFRVALVSGIILVSAAGYLGASLVYGPNHYKW